jgi:hypothetical protein
MSKIGLLRLAIFFRCYEKLIMSCISHPAAFFPIKPEKVKPIIFESVTILKKQKNSACGDI